MKTILFCMLLGLALQCDSCAPCKQQSAQAQPTPLFQHIGPADPKAGKWVRNRLGLDDGWTAEAIQRDQADRARYEQRVQQWEAQNSQGGSK